MKPVCVLLPLLTAPLLVPALFAQAPAAHPHSVASHTPHSSRTAHPGTRSAHAGCIELPELSPKIPALPASLPCARALYTLTTEPGIKLDYASPLEGHEFAQALGLEPSTFSLGYIDTKIGAGPLAEPHKWYTIQYTGYRTDGFKFDSSLDRNEPIVLHIGEHQVIPGWDTGFAGMHVGGKRRLFIPYQLAYGPNGRPPSIPAKSELIFDVELIAQSDTEPKPAPKPEPKPATAVPQPSTPPAAATPRAAPPQPQP